jgi:hypothetical protein
MAERVDITLPNKINDVGWLNSPNPLFDAQRLFDAVAKPRWLSHDHPRDGGLTSWMLSSSGVSTARSRCRKPSVDALKDTARIGAAKRTGKLPPGLEMTSACRNILVCIIRQEQG